MTNGKGDSPRPLSVGRGEYDERWARTFGLSCTQCSVALTKATTRLWGTDKICLECLKRAMHVGPSTQTEEGE